MAGSVELREKSLKVYFGILVLVEKSIEMLSYLRVTPCTHQR